MAEGPRREDHAFDPSIILEVATEYLLGETPLLTREQVAQSADIDLDVAVELWRSLGFPSVGPGRPAFTNADVEAIKATRRLIDLAVVDADAVHSFTRAVGRTYSRMAEWQTRLLFSAITDSATDDDLGLEMLAELMPLVEKIQAYVWRRHLLGAAGRLLLRESSDPEGTPTAAGFVDIVGYTTRARRMTSRQLANMVDSFEQVTTGLITDHGGQVVKTIGDEVLFTLDDPVHCAHLALELTELHDDDPVFPEVRVGVAYGSVLSRFGDVFGQVVNMASRLTSIARPGTAVIDRTLADLVAADQRLRVRRMRRVAVKGYDHLEPWSLRRPKTPHQ
jgi:adenylate cyclase